MKPEEHMHLKPDEPRERTAQITRRTERNRAIGTNPPEGTKPKELASPNRPIELPEAASGRSAAPEKTIREGGEAVCADAA